MPYCVTVIVIALLVTPSRFAETTVVPGFDVFAVKTPTGEIVAIWVFDEDQFTICVMSNELLPLIPVAVNCSVPASGTFVPCGDAIVMEFKLGG
jgi:hypothetical protein